METHNRTLARTIDLINEHVIKYYEREIEDVPDPLEIQGIIWKKYKINDKIFESALRIMKEEGYIEYVFNGPKDTIIRELKRTPKGLLLYLNGGLTKQQKRNELINNLYKIGQISLIIAAIYYLIEIGKSFYDFFSCHFK